MKPTLIRSVSNQRGTISFAPKQIVILVLVLLIILGVVFFIVKHATNQEGKIPNHSGDENLEEDLLAMVNGNIELSEKETLGESVKVTAKLDNDENVYNVMVYPLYNGIEETREGIEAMKKDNGVYEAEINFEELNIKEGYYQLKAVLKAYNGSEKEILSEDTVNYSKTGVSYAHAYQKEDGRTAVQITALDKGEVLVSTTNVAPTANDTRWAKYEAGKEYIIATPEEEVENVYVWYKVGNQIINAADSGISVMSYADGLGVIGSTSIGASAYGEAPVFNNSGYKRKDILTITLSKTNNVPTNSINQWDVSQNKDKSVWAYIARSTGDNTKYDLYICGNGSLIAPQNASFLFYYYSNCKEIRGLENLDVSNVRDMSYMFDFCKDITNLASIKNWQVDNVTDMSYMFYGCSGIFDLPSMEDWQVDNVETMSSMFMSCSNITNLTPIQNWQVNSVRDMSYMFSSCSSIRDLTPIQDWQVNSVTNMSSMFQSCSNVTSLTPIQDWHVNNVKDMSYMFSSCSGIRDLTPIQDWQVDNVETMSSMFMSCSNVTNLTPIQDWHVNNVKNMSYMFYFCNSIIDLTPIQDWQVNNVTNMSYMFSSCGGITDLTPIQDWHVDNVKNMSALFQFCSGIRDLAPIQDWHVDNVENMSNMFAGCSNLRCVSLINWNTAKVTSNYGMFNNCFNLEYLLLGNNFNKIQSSSSYHFAESSASIITFREELVQFLKYLSYNQDCPATLFVKNTDIEPSLESTFEAADTGNMFGPERIGEVISLIGENPLTVPLGTTYKDPGVNVGLYPATDLVNYPDIKLTVETDNSAVESALQAGNTGEYVVTYTLKHDGTEFCKETRTVKIEKAQNPFIMEWTIPAGADGNDASGNPQTIIQLPIVANGANNYTVDWGDGQKETFGSTADLPSHTYHNTAEQTYEIKITGHVQTFGYFASFTSSEYEIFRPTKGYRKEYYPYTQYLTKIIAWGELDTEHYSFEFCKNLKEVASPTAETFKNVTRFDYTFMYCSELKSIPEDLFAGGDKVKDFIYTFCRSGLSGEIPENLFANNPSVTNFSGTFYACSSLSGKIPKDLFISNPNVTDFSFTFSGCSSLSGTIPSDLFANNSAVITFGYTFSGCNSLSGEIPENLFANNQKVMDFGCTFQNCSGLNGAIPKNLFVNNQEVTNFSSTFCDCKGLTGMIPADLFAKNLLAKYFSQTFYNCSNLTAGEITLNSQKITSMSEMFRGCRNLESLVFGSEFKDFTGVNMFDGCGNLKAIILLNDASSPDQVGTILEELNNTNSSVKDLGLPDQTIIYVANEETEKVYEQAWSHVPEERIHPVVEAKEPNPTIVGLGKPFVDPGYTVAGFETTEKEKYEQYGFTVSIEGIPVDTGTVGEKYVTYSLLKDQPIHFTVMEIYPNSAESYQRIFETKAGTTWQEFCEGESNSNAKESGFNYFLIRNDVEYRQIDKIGGGVYKEKELINSVKGTEIIFDNTCYYAEMGHIGECVKGNTNILTSITGETILAKDIQKGDSIVYYNFEKNQLAEGTVSRVYIHKDATSFVTYTFTDGTKLEVTDYHPIYTEAGWKSYTHRNGYEVPEIGDNIKTPEGWKTLTKIEASTGLEDYYDFAIVDANGNAIDNYFGNGTLVQNSIQPEPNLEAQP